MGPQFYHELALHATDQATAVTEEKTLLALADSFVGCGSGNGLVERKRVEASA